MNLHDFANFLCGTIGYIHVFVAMYYRAKERHEQERRHLAWAAVFILMALT